MKLLFYVVLTTLVVSMASCVTGVVEPIVTQAYPAKADWHEVQILTEAPERPYEALAKITAYADYYDMESVLDRELRQRAARLGADAVISGLNVQRYYSAASAGSRRSGLAIKYKTIAANQR